MLLQPFLEKPLPEPALTNISIYIDLLLHWNARVNLTAVRDPEEIVTRHFGESLFLARHLFASLGIMRVPHPSALFAEGGDSRVIDIGSGAGFPGLPLKIWAPALALTLIESNNKKSVFLREVIRTLTLTDINVLTARAETLTVGEPSSSAPRSTVAPADIVTLRAVERFDNILPIAARFVRPGGRLALLIGSGQVPALTTLAPTIQWAAPIPIPGSHSRVLSIGVHQ